MLFIKKREKIDIPDGLKLELENIKVNPIKYSLSYADIDNATEEINDTKLKSSFKEVLFNFIDNKGLTDSFVYKKAKVDKRTFSKIRTGSSKYVSRNTAICLGLALELNHDDFDKLMDANLIHLGDNTRFDVAIKWCIKNKIYDIDDVNDILYACDLPLLTR